MDVKYKGTSSAVINANNKQVSIFLEESRLPNKRRNPFKMTQVAIYFSQKNLRSFIVYVHIQQQQQMCLCATN